MPASCSKSGPLSASRSAPLMVGQKPPAAAELCAAAAADCLRPARPAAGRFGVLRACGREGPSCN